MHENIIWKTKKGEKILLKDIKTNHLQSIIIFLKRKGADSKLLNNFEQELRLRKLNNIENNPDHKDLF